MSLLPSFPHPMRQERMASRSCRAGDVPEADCNTERAIAQIEEDGFATLPPLSGRDGRTSLSDRFDDLMIASRTSVRLSQECDLFVQLVGRSDIRIILDRLVGSGARCVRAMAFDKTAEANWSVPWHQDRIIAVKQMRPSSAVANWTVKKGIAHCEPAASFLERMLTLRWHIDSATQNEGCLQVLPGTHRLGRLGHEQIAEQLRSRPALPIPVPSGAVFAMRPLLLHSSRRRVAVGCRRVLQVEIAAGDPPSPLEWAWA